MFIPNTENLKRRRENILLNAGNIKYYEFKFLKEALEIQGSVILFNEETYLRIDDVFAISFLVDLYVSFSTKVEKEVNIHYWEDHGHRIDIFKLSDRVKIVNSHSFERKSIILTIEEFSKQFAVVLKAISDFSFLIYYPLVQRKDYFDHLEEMSKLTLEWKSEPNK